MMTARSRPDRGADRTESKSIVMTSPGYSGSRFAPGHRRGGAARAVGVQGLSPGRAFGRQWSGLAGDLFAVLVLEFADTLLERSDLEVPGVRHHDDRHVCDRRLDAL